MKKLIRNLLVGVLLSAVTLHAQKMSIVAQPIETTPILTNIDWASASDVQVLLQAVQSTPTVPADTAPRSGNFYSAQHAPGTQNAWPPLPCNSRNVPLWDLGGGMYLMDDLDVDYSAPKTESMMVEGRMMAMDVPSPGDGSGTNNGDFSPMFSLPIVDYGTNLWIAQVNSVSNSYFGILSNSIADISYEIQYITDLTQTTNWQSANWFVNGSELTNWTPFSVPMISPTNLFLRARSWASDNGSGLPDWWVEEYYGTNAINPDAQDGANDGWTIYQKFAMGANPTVAVTPPTPQGLAAVLNSGGNSATISWLPSPVPVTSYTVEDSDGNTFNYSAGTESFDDSTSDFGVDSFDGDIDTTFKIQAHYSSGNSAWSAPVSVEQNSVIAALVAGPNGTAYIAVSALPPNTSAIRMTEYDNYELTPIFMTNFDIPISHFTNGFYPLPNNTPTGDGNFRQYWTYYWQAQAVGTNGNGLTATTWLGSDYTSAQDGYKNNWLVPPFFDGRAQLKQNLIFQLRAAVIDRPFQYTEIWTNYGINYSVSSPTNYAYAGYYYFEPYNTDSGVEYEPLLDWFLPFEENYFDRNFVFDTSLLDSSGHTTTGVGGQYSYYGSGGGLTIQGGMPTYFGSSFNLHTAYFFQGAATNGTPIASLMATNQTRWLSTYALDSDEYFLTPEIGVTNWYDTDWDTYYNTYYGILPDSVNYFGLPFVSDKVAWGNDGGSMDTLYANSYIENEDGYFYPEVAQPQFEIVEYDSWIAPNFWYNVFTNGTDYPGMAGLSLTHTNTVLITGVGNLNQFACYAKLAVANSIYAGVYGFLEQYFDQAYKVDDNGNVTTNTTGILSPYGNYFATEPGEAALVTMPDVDTGQRGTNFVYAIKLGLDVNHDGTIDTSFAGADNTSAGSSYIFWTDNGYDRYVLDSDDGVYYDDSVSSSSAAASCPYTPSTPTPNCNYLDGAGHRIIPCERDLQNFSRLWVCGITTNLLAALPAGSTITLNWGDVGSPNTGNPTIDIFTAADSDGGVGYLTNSDTADAQVDSAYCPYIGRLAPGSNLVLNASTFANSWAGNHFIMCGVNNGIGGLNLTISDSNGNVLAQTTAYIQIVDIKQMYERWTVGENPSLAPTNAASLSTEGLPAGISAFQYTLPTAPNTPYILYVHGWNMEPWEKDAFAESAFKRLYWQGYQGRFGEFRWPTTYGFTGNYWTALTDPRSFDNSEFQAWQSGLGLMNKLNDLNSEYPGHVYALAHSHGNVVMGEALRLAAQNGLGQIANTYVASQAAISAHIYDSSVTTPYLLPFTYTYPTYPLAALGSQNYGPTTPDIYVDRLTNNVAAAGRSINFYNENDFALAMPRWGFDQITKPDYLPLNSFIYYNGSLGDSAPWNHFYLSPIVGDDGTLIDIVTNVTNLYKIISYAAESRSTALGATPTVTTLTRDIDMTSPDNKIWPTDTSGHNYADHFWHSAEFRGDAWQMWNYWNTLLRSSTLGFNIQNP